MIRNLRQRKINEVMGRILRGLAHEQHINGVPIQLSIGLPEGRGVVPNCILVYNAPDEIVRDLKYLEEAVPGVEVTFGFGGARAFIDVEHLVIEPARGTLYTKVRKLLAGGMV